MNHSVANVLVLSMTLGSLNARFDKQQGNFLLWAAFGLGAGCGGYFLLPREFTANELWFLGGVWVLSLFVWCASWRHCATIAFCSMLICTAAFGLLRSEMRSQSVASPVLFGHYYGSVEGKIAGLDQSATGRPRILLCDVRLDGVRSDNTPKFVRISVDPEQLEALSVNTRVTTTGWLSPPQGPAEPMGFDFGRYLWYQSIGAVGYSRTPVLRIGEPNDSWSFLTIRQTIARFFRDSLRERNAAFAIAVTTGLRGDLDQGTRESLRRSNLAHLLAISGLHMGLLAATVYAAMRSILCVSTYVALYLPVRKLSAVVAIIAASIYLGLSGGNVSTERAYVMVLVMLCAILLNRRALTLRSVACAAIFVLMIWPESIVSPGFQMSFAATIGLVTVFGWLHQSSHPIIEKLRSGNFLVRGFMSLAISSFVAGAATAPFSAFHFNGFARYGLLANILAVPAMGLGVMPSLIAITALSPLGVEAPALSVLALSSDWILGVADWVSGLPNARIPIPSADYWILPAFSISVCVVLLWNGRERWIFVIPAVLALWGWGHSSRPEVLVGSDGKLVGIMTPAGRALSRERTSAFIASVWLENDGSLDNQSQAARKWDDEITKMPTFELTHLPTKKALKAWQGCGPSDVVISGVEVAANDPRVGFGCQIYDTKRLSQTGAMAFSDGTWRTSASVQGKRRWSPSAYQFD